MQTPPKPQGDGVGTDDFWSAPGLQGRPFKGCGSEEVFASRALLLGGQRLQGTWVRIESGWEADVEPQLRWRWRKIPESLNREERRGSLGSSPILTPQFQSSAPPGAPRARSRASSRSGRSGPPARSSSSRAACSISSVKEGSPGEDRDRRPWPRPRSWRGPP